MTGYISAKETAEKWNISQRRVAILCCEGRVDGAVTVGNMWIIPSNAKKPADKRALRGEVRASTALKPFLKWAGGKGQLVDELENTIFAEERHFTKYCEPMVGGGALFFNILSKHNFEQIYIGDVNRELINSYNVIKTEVDGLIARLQKMKTAFLAMDGEERKKYYYSVRDKYNETELTNSTSVEKAAYFIFLNKTCFNGLYRVNRKGLFNVPMGAYKNPAVFDEESLLCINKALQNVVIVCGDYSLSRDFIDRNTLVYFDPPYRPISATSAFNSYNADAFDDDEQIRLYEFINDISGVGAKIILSNSDPKNVDPDDTFFDSLYSSYNIRRVSASRMINSKADGRGSINELIISN